MNILMVGDIVGSGGRSVFAKVVKRYRAEHNLDFVVVNAENAAGGRGITAKIVKELLSAGADVITLGDHTWDQKEMQQYILTEPRLLRPANFAPGCPGNGLVTVSSAWGDVTVINLVGRVFMKPYDCPFRKVDQLLKETSDLGNIVLVDMHAEATSEKIAMGRYLDGRVSAVVGTHTHVQTSDEEVFSGGTAYITDLGMTGAKDSIIGRDVDAIMTTFVTGMPAKFSLAKNKVMLEGSLINVDRNTGRAKSIIRVRESE
jgi:metallophosphoesterase (TIGR00282 family)